MPKVFISHSWIDNDISRKIAHDLKRDGAEIWIDYARISGGESLPERISEALDWCDTLVLVWSNSAATSKWVAREWTAALSLDKTIIPCLLDDTKLPPILASLLYINFKNVDTGYEELCRTLRLTTFEERQKAEAEKLKLEQERLEAERKEKEKQRRIQAEQEKERQQKLQAEQERQKREQERLRLQEAEREEKEKQRRWQAERERRKQEQERLQKLQKDKHRKERIEKLKRSLITKKTGYAILSVMTIFLGIYIITTLLSSNSLKNQNRENVSEKIASESYKTNLPIFRSEPTSLSSDQVKEMLKKNDFFDAYDNKAGKGFNNQFETKIINGKSVVIDHASGLMWQQSGSANYMTYDKAKEYIQELNSTKFAGFNDWRLPTLEEAMSLMEPKRLNDNLYIDPKFDVNQWWIWTADQVSGESRAWVVGFSYGSCNWLYLFNVPYVRAVRSGQSSTE